MPNYKKVLGLSARSARRRPRQAGRPSPRRASGALLESLLAHGGSCIAVVEGQALRYTLVSPDYQAIAPSVPMLGRTYRQVFPEAADHGAEARLRQVLDTGEPWLVDAYHAPIAGKPDATWQGKVVRLPLEAGQEPSALIVLLDITERIRAEQQLQVTLERSRRAEAALRVNEQQLRVALQAGHMGTWAWEVDTDTILTDPLHRLLWDIPGEESRVPFNLLVSRIHPEDVGKVPTREQLLQVSGPFDIELRIRRRDGQVRWLRCSSTPVYDAKRSLTQIIGVDFDITERKRAEEALRVSKEDLEGLVAERTAKLQELVGELEHFSYTITHDMRAPLRSMRGFAELVLEMGVACPPAEQQTLLNRVVTAAERMDLLITDALSYSRAVRQQLPLGPVDLGVLLRGMLDTYPEFQAAKAHIQVQGALPLVLGNQAGLTQVFSNLLGNAIKFTKPGHLPEIRIWAEEVRSAERGMRNADHGAAGHHSAFHTPHCPFVRVWVEDQGIGISPTMIPRVFNMFARGNTGHPGTGIGLALVRKVVDRMGGRVGVVSEEGMGSRFWLEFLPGDPRSPMALPVPLPPPGPGAIL